MRVVGGLCGLFAVSPVELGGQQSKNAAVRIDADHIGGVVTAPTGRKPAFGLSPRPLIYPKFAKIVVTDDQGRYLLPDLPKANYAVWVRGYGLIGSPKVTAAPGKTLSLKALAAPGEAKAAE